MDELPAHIRSHCFQMKILIIVLIIALWYAVGYYGFKFWWLKDGDFTKSDRRMCLIIAIAGPLTFLVGWAVHSGSDGDEVITNKK